MLQFAYPWLFLLLPLPLLMHWLAPPHHEPRLAVYVPFMRILARVAGGTSAAGTVIPRRRRMQLAHGHTPGARKTPPWEHAG